MSHSLDDELLAPILDRVARGTITVRVDPDSRWPWYFDDSRHCPFAGYVLDKLVEQGYCYWDSMVGQAGHLRVRQDGARAVRLDDKGRELHDRLDANRDHEGANSSATRSVTRW